jgi:hypothetical protein
MAELPRYWHGPGMHSGIDALQPHFAEPADKQPFIVTVVAPLLHVEDQNGERVLGRDDLRGGDYVSEAPFGDRVRLSNVSDDTRMPQD